MRSIIVCYQTGREIPLWDKVYWQLSALLARRFYPPLKLYADRQSAERLILDWGIEFDEVDITTIPKMTLGAHPMCWSAGKLAAMAAEADHGKPFFIVDGDAFIRRPLPISLTSAPMFVQCAETTLQRRRLQYRKNTQYPINELLPELQLPDFMARYSRQAGQRVFNMGLFGGINTDAILEYAQIALKTFVRNRHNTQVFYKFHRYKPHFLGIACIAEQWALGAFCAWKGIQPAALMDRVDSFNLSRSHEVGSFVHLFTSIRRLPHYRRWAKHELKRLVNEEKSIQRIAA